LVTFVLIYQNIFYFNQLINTLSMSKLYELIYTSKAKIEPIQRELKSMLEKARDKNLKLNVTGLLAYYNGEFIQLIEGPECNIKELMTTIAADERHHEVKIYWEGHILTRGFSSWEMGFVNLNSAKEIDLEGYSNFFVNNFQFTNLKSTSNVGKDLMVRLSRTLPYSY
jgi:hypothetical protein